MKGIVEERAIRLGEHIVENKDTVRRTAAKFGISKSTVHKDVTKRRGLKTSPFILVIRLQHNQEREYRNAYNIQAPC